MNSQETEQQSTTQPSGISSIEITSQQQALAILFNGIDTAQKRGAFNLEEAEFLFRAKKLFIKKDEESSDQKEEDEEK